MYDHQHHDHPFRAAIKAYLHANGWSRTSAPGEQAQWRHPANPRVRFASGDAVVATPEFQGTFGIPVSHVILNTAPTTGPLSIAHFLDRRG